MDLRETPGAGDLRLARRRGRQLQPAARAIAVAVARDGRDLAAAVVPAIARIHFPLDSGFEFRHNEAR